MCLLRSGCFGSWKFWGNTFLFCLRNISFFFYENYQFTQLEAQDGMVKWFALHKKVDVILWRARVNPYD
jgi:hypothetical protein